MGKAYDYIICGAGSAGCVLAARLSEDPSVKVLLLEAGGKNNGLLVKMPAGVGGIIFEKNAYNWGFHTEPEPHLDNRKIWWPRGKGLGGSSAINGMIYTRGHPNDYDEWRQMGLSGWAWDDVLPYFRRLENHHGGASDQHGEGGPLTVSRGESDSAFHDAFLEAGRQAGYPITDDFNGAQQEGFGLYDLTIKDGQRWSTRRAYLDGAKDRPNLTCVTGARLTKVTIENGRATGVEYVRGKSASPLSATADRDVILSAGAVHTPQMLQVSGIGPADHLRSIGVTPIHDLPGVGANLQDHIDVVLTWKSEGLETVYALRKGLGALKMAGTYAFTGKGHGRQQFLESGAYVKSREGIDRPDLQLHAVLAILTAIEEDDVKSDGFSVHACVLRPESRGTVMAGSADPLADPLIHANYMASPKDMDTLRRGVRIIEDVVGQPALAPYRRDRVQPPGPLKTDEEVDAWIRSRAETLYHPVGTCKMGRAEDPMAVVDEQLKVLGIEGLRVVDASVMPTLVGANTNAATIMIAEKAADMILKQPAPARVAA
ncbi:MAG: choline dehydrogenase [Pseudomonadota bacterium]